MPKSRAYVHDQQQLIPTSIESFPNTSAGSDGNSVGRLQEFCMKRGASPPRYNERSCGVSGAGAGAGLFSVECVWSDIVTLGRATNKKEAKRRAAAEMLSKLSGTRSSQGSNNHASRNGDVHLWVSKSYEKNCATRNIESSFSPIREENYFSRPKEESYSKYVKEERMSFPKPTMEIPR